MSDRYDGDLFHLASSTSWDKLTNLLFEKDESAVKNVSVSVQSLDADFPRSGFVNDDIDGRHR
jgi:hypothetical protein